MPIRTADEYVQSLRDRKLNVYLFGERVENPVDLARVFQEALWKTAEAFDVRTLKTCRFLTCMLEKSSLPEGTPDKLALRFMQDGKSDYSHEPSLATALQFDVAELLEAIRAKMGGDPDWRLPFTVRSEADETA